MLTSHTIETEVLAAFSSGAEAYCIKGSSLDVLLTAIATIAQGGVYLYAKVALLALACLTAQLALAGVDKLSNFIKLSNFTFTSRLPNRI